MGDTGSTSSRILRTRLGGVVYQFKSAYSYTLHRGEPWAPAVNAFRCPDSFVICVELAGVDRNAIELTVEPGLILIRGRRSPPEPESCAGPLQQVLAFEIDHGPFEREIALPERVDPDRTEAKQREGLLWIHLPLANHTHIQPS